MQRTSFEDVNCSVAQCLEVVGEWWTLLIIRDAFLGVRSSDEFQARLGISRNVLNRRLSRLVCSHHGEPLDARFVTAEPGRGAKEGDFDRTHLAYASG
jgi:hypothetical protein